MPWQPFACRRLAWRKVVDRAIVERLTGEPYETVERKLRNLAQVDDAPVSSIGKVWRAKAPLELLDLFADRITAAELDRFFEIAESLLVAPDPILEMEPDKRWMAQVYGKVRGESGLLFRSVFDALVKLAVRGRDYELRRTECRSTCRTSRRATAPRRGRDPLAVPGVPFVSVCGGRSRGLH